MRKKGILLCIVCVIIIVILIILVGCFPITFFGKLEKLQEERENFLIYVTDEFQNCAVCVDVNYMIDFYQENYDVDFLEFNIGTHSAKSYQKFLSTVGYTSSSELVAPAIIYMEDGELKTIINNIVDERAFRNILIEKQFIDDKYQNMDTLMSKLEFDKLFQEKEKTLLAIYNYEQDTYVVRERLLKLSEQYDFNFRIVYAGVSDSGLISMELSEKVGSDNFMVPSLMIIQNSQVIDYLNSIKSEEILDFLKKNEII